MTSEGSLPGENRARHNVLALFETSVAKLDQAVALSVRIIERAGEVSYSRWGPKTGPVVLGLYAKSIKTARAVRLTVTAGLVEDAQTLCRSLLETEVAIHYILRGRGDQRAEEFLANTVAQTDRVANAWIDTIGLRRQGAQLKRLVQSSVLDYPNISQTRMGALRKHGYAGMPLIETFRSLGRIKDYQVTYRALSKYPHTNDLEGHVTVGDQPGLGLVLGTSDKPEVRRSLDNARALLCRTMERVSSAMGLGYLAEISRVSVSFDSELLGVVKMWKRYARSRGRNPRLGKR